MLRFFIFVLFLSPFLAPQDSAAQLMPFKSYGIKDGLNDNNVQALTMDERGLLWVGTDFGLYWFDGKRFYQPQIKAVVGQLYINDFFKDSNDDIWVLTFFNGLYKYHNGHFTNFLIDTVSKNVIPNTIIQMVQLSENKYVVLSQECPFLFDGKRFSVFDSTNAGLLRSTNSIAALSDRILLFSTSHGVFLYACEAGKFRRLAQELKDIAVNKILASDKWCLVATEKGLLSFANTGANTFLNACQIYLPGQAIRDMTIDVTGRIWALGDSACKIEKGKITNYGPGNGLPENIRRVFCDKQGMVWLAHRKGVSMLGDEYYEFSVTDNGKNNTGISAMNVDEQGNLWVGAGNGIAIERNGSYLFTHDVGNEQVGGVSSIFKNHNGTLTAATSSGIISIAASSIKRYVGAEATNVCEDSEGSLYYGDVGGRIYRFKDNAACELKVEGYFPEMITCMYTERGFVWAGYRGLGMKKYRLKDDSLLLVKAYNAGDMRVRSYTTDNKGNILWGTRTNGVYIISKSGDSLVAHITVQNGLNANWVKGMMYDTTDGKLYLATNSGINIISGDYRSPIVTQLKINNENINRETNCIVKKDDVFYIGTNEGVLKWMPGNMHKDSVAPHVYFTKINIQGLKDFSVAPYTADAGAITLPYDQHIISFEYAGICLKDPDNVRYHYILEGQNNEWSPITEYNHVEYNLKPGDYKFKVAARDGDGIWSITPAAFHFIIRPPFWATWWFIMLIAIAVALAAYGAYRYKLNQALAVEMLRNNISTDLHDDIGSTLSSISILSDMALTEPSNTQMLDMIKDIRDNSTSLLEKMDDIVWSINSNNDTLENLIVRFRRFAASLLEAKNIEYTIDVTPAIKNLKLSMSFRRHIYLILKETINNLIKYSNCTKVFIGVLYKDGHLEITVQDNGIGFDASSVHYGNGLLNMKQRAKHMNAVINITSDPGAGTKMNFRVKIK